MDLAKAASETRKNWSEKAGGLPDAKRHPEGIGGSHINWMLYGIELGFIGGEKAHRWLGYAQGYLVCDQMLSLEECKSINKAA